MKITVEFDSEEEFEAFRVSGKKTRTKKTDEEAAPEVKAPAPLAPPTAQASGFPGAAGFAPPAAGATQQGAGPFAPAVDPAITALVERIKTRGKAAIVSGQPLDVMLQWFRGECQKAGVDASQLTMEQIETSCLPKMSLPVLENIAKLMNA